MNNRPKHVTIAGAGLVGSLLAVILNRRGYLVTIFEKRPDMRVAGISGGRSINLALAQRGINALRIAGLMDEIEPLLIPMRGRMLHEIDSSPEFWPYGQREHEVIYSVSRGGLNNIMMTAAETDRRTKIFFEHGVVGVDLDRHQIQVQDCLSGETRTVDYEYLIGADGGGSSVRTAIIEHADGACTAEMLDHDYKELEIPPGPDKTHRIEKEALHIWPRGGYMLIALPNLDGSFTVTLFLPNTGSVSYETLQSESQVADFFHHNFPSAAEQIPNFVGDFFDNPVGELGTIRCFPWTSNRAMLIGDAAHAIVPFHGQGMNCGFEDCAKFVEKLDELDDDWNAAARSFQAMRKPNTDAIAEMALENYVVMRDSVSDPQFQRKKELGFVLERQFPKQFIPRYSMVMFHDIPYAQAMSRGRVQDEILTELIATAASNAEVDFQLAAARIQAELPPLDFAF